MLICDFGQFPVERVPMLPMPRFLASPDPIDDRLAHAERLLRQVRELMERNARMRLWAAEIFPSLSDRSDRLDGRSRQ
jgi:hypothetical protein